MDRRDRRILFRVDGGRELGMGHVIRCLALAQALFSTVPDIAFLMRDHHQGVEKVKTAGFPVITIPVREDPDHTAQLIRQYRPGLVITDLYPVTNTYIERLKSTGVRVICLTGLGRVQVPADIVINGDVRFRGGHPPVVNKLAARCYLGPGYFILRPQFLEGGGRRRQISDCVSRVLVTLGGSDPRMLTLRATQALDRVPGDFHITVVMGPAFQRNHAGLENLRWISKPVSVVSDADNMAGLMRAADLAITAGGFTLYELAATGTSSVVLCQKTHQEQTAREFEKAGSCVNLGLEEQVSEDRIAQVVTELMTMPSRRRAMSAVGLVLVDGYGLNRVANIIRGALYSLDAPHLAEEGEC